MIALVQPQEAQQYLSVSCLEFLQKRITSSIEIIRNFEDAGKSNPNIKKQIHEMINDEFKQTLKNLKLLIGDQLFLQLINTNALDNFLLDSQQLYQNLKETISKFNNNSDTQSKEILQSLSTQMQSQESKLETTHTSVEELKESMNFNEKLQENADLNIQEIFQTLEIHEKCIENIRSKLSTQASDPPPIPQQPTNTAVSQMSIAASPAIQTQNDLILSQKTQEALLKLPKQFQEARKKHGPFNYGYRPQGVQATIEKENYFFEGEVIITWGPEKTTCIGVGRGLEIINGLILYEGWWLNDLKDGKGRQIESNGNVIIGDFKNGKVNGMANYYSHNGDTYSGEWVNNQSSGNGIYVWANGDRYQGFWINDQQNGKGTLYYSNGDSFASDTWVNNQMHGSGIYTYKDGTQEERQYEMGTLKSSKKI